MQEILTLSGQIKEENTSSCPFRYSYSPYENRQDILETQYWCLKNVWGVLFQPDLIAKQYMQYILTLAVQNLG